MTATLATLDQAAMVADDLGDQSQAEAAAGRLGGDERLKQMRAHVVGNARTVVAYGDEQRQVLGAIATTESTDRPPGNASVHSQRAEGVGVGQLLQGGLR